MATTKKKEFKKVFKTLATYRKEEMKNPNRFVLVNQAWLDMHPNATTAFWDALRAEGKDNNWRHFWDDEAGVWHTGKVEEGPHYFIFVE